MKFLHATRRVFLGVLIIAAFGGASAQSAYPAAPIRIIVPYPAGGATDTLARFVGEELQTAWKTTVVVENRPGASGNIGGEAVARSAPDGYTVLMGITALAQLPAMSKMPFDPLKDLAPVVEVARSNSMLVVPATSPVNTLKEFIALAKENPKKFNFGSFGNGTSAHIQGELLNMQAGLDMVHVPYKGSAPLLVDLMGGQLTAAFVDSASLAPHLKSGKLKPLAATGAQRNRLLPDVPTFVELGYKDFEPYGWFGMFMPAGTPPAVISKFAAEVARILHNAQGQSRVESLGLTPVGNKPEEFARTVTQDSALYARIIKAANIRMD